ncbi:hypothetical protein Enr8_04920 [Blastopirellula retiformator]|uniref:Uncharacterized protein n=2 Tax=Blastopirellula retiformator TaxID=2527970 RepID=A0A5C5VJM2_9BACT|nr:hypothetical protein Enr8_04920 [Blastopirellula retiformator]
MWIVFGLPAIGAGLLLMRGLYLALFPPDRKLIIKAIEYARQTTGRPVKDIYSGDLRGYDGQRMFIRVFFDDDSKFGSPTGPPRKYYAVDLETGEVTESSASASRPFRWGPPDPLDAAEEPSAGEQ